MSVHSVWWLERAQKERAKRASLVFTCEFYIDKRPFALLRKVCSFFELVFGYFHKDVEKPLRPMYNAFAPRCVGEWCRNLAVNALGVMSISFSLLIYVLAAAKPLFTPKCVGRVSKLGGLSVRRHVEISILYLRYVVLDVNALV